MLIEQVWNCPFSILRGQRLKFPNYDVFLDLSLKIVFILENSADPAEMQVAKSLTNIPKCTILPEPSLLLYTKHVQFTLSLLAAALVVCC